MVGGKKSDRALAGRGGRLGRLVGLRPKREGEGFPIFINDFEMKSKRGIQREFERSFARRSSSFTSTGMEIKFREGNQEEIEWNLLWTCALQLQINTDPKPTQELRHSLTINSI